MESKIKLQANNITLDRVKNSDYWKLISIVVWSHYSEKGRQDESMIEISEKWYGKLDAGGGSSHNDKWNNPAHTEPRFTRTLGSIEIEFRRSDFVVWFVINVITGNLITYSAYIDKEEKSTPNFYIRPIEITNWMLENDLLTCVGYDKKNN